MSKKILLISSGQPSLNPRLVKEADTLTGAGYNVTVLYAYWNHWGTKYDEQLLAGKNWKAIRLAGDPGGKRFTWFLSRTIFKISRFILQKTGTYKFLANLAIARSSYFLIQGAKKQKADLYIAHNLGALPAAAKTASRYKKPYGFDAEDFHRQEVSDNSNSFHYKLCKHLEDKYLPKADYITAGSPLIAAQYATLYKRRITSLLNVFPKKAAITNINNQKTSLKLFWFSQTIGPNRGLELIIEAIGVLNLGIEFHLLGNITQKYQGDMANLAKTFEINKNKLFFYGPVNPDELFKIAAQFDIGLASETGFCLNNSIALSNKIFTYILSGLAIVASNTPAQKGFMDQYPETGKIYEDAAQLAEILNRYHQNRELLYETKKNAFKAGQNQLNWEIEGKKFLNVIENV